VAVGDVFDTSSLTGHAAARRRSTLLSRRPQRSNDMTAGFVGISVILIDLVKTAVMC